MDKSVIQQFIEWIIHHGGFYLLVAVIFAETGLLVGFFFPGDSLLFAAGIFLNELVAKVFALDVDGLTFGPYHIVLIVLVMTASVLGNFAAYWFGYKTGPLLYERKETWLFKHKHLNRAREFYHKYGKGTIFLAKFLPIIRTFAPIIAGVVKMDKA
ncbi:MAG TPA: VTT domain-containing protein, partial [Chitinophagaceae bacterium]